MVITALVTSVVGFLSHYFVKAGEKFSEKVGEKLAEKSMALAGAVTDKLKEDPYSALTLERLKADPNSEPDQIMLKSLLTKKLTDDKDFKSQIENLLADVQKHDPKNIFISGDRNVFVDGDNYGNISTGDINYNK